MSDDVHMLPEGVDALLRSSEVARDLERRGLKVERSAKHLAPVDTGRLRASITHELGQDDKGLFVDVGTSVDYAIFQELGTRFMPAHPYLRPALGAGAD